MRPWLLPAAERIGRYALNRRGYASRFVETRIARVHAYDAPGGGDLPTTVVLHGIGSAATPYGPLLARLRKSVRRIVAPELPGHGFSSQPREPLTPDRLYEAVKDTLDELVPEPFVLSGHSLGGALALRYAVDRPSRLRALVLVSPAGARTTDEEWRELVGAFRLSTTREARHLLARLYHRPPWFLPALGSEFLATLDRPAVRHLLDTATLADAPAPDELRSLRVPLLLVWGRSERLLPRSALAYFRANLPAETVVLEPEGFGHCPHLDDPARLADQIITFLRGLP